MSWLSWVATPPFPSDERALHRLALEARPRLEAIEKALAQPISTDELLRLAELVTFGRPALTLEDLASPPRFFAWLWPLLEDGDTTKLATLLGADPPRKFDDLVVSGRSEMPPLEGESVAEWVLVQHAGDGHQFMFWDPTFKGGVRLLWVDNSERDVVMYDWRSAEDFLRRRFFKQMIQLNGKAIAESARTPLRRALDTWMLLGGISALFVATIALIGLLVFAAGRC